MGRRPPYFAAVDVEAFQLFFTLLALLALGAAAFAIGVRLLPRRAPTVASLAGAIDDAALWIAFLVAGVATAGSLYFSEVANFAPCQLCWYQRIAMYPLALIRSVRWYAGPLAAGGGLISAYHYLIEWRPSLEGGACGLGPPCAVPWFRELGFVTLAFMALCGFVAILALVVPSPTTPQEPS
jgi:Disulfide bond formation protein DsbB